MHAINPTSYSACIRLNLEEHADVQVNPHLIEINGGLIVSFDAKQLSPEMARTTPLVGGVYLGMHPFWCFMDVNTDDRVTAIVVPPSHLVIHV